MQGKKQKDKETKQMSGNSRKFRTIVLRRSPLNARGIGAYRPRTGIDFIPNMNCNLKIVVPFQHPQQLKASLSATGITSETLPDAFAWNDESSVKKSRMPDFQGSWIMVAPDQSQCGSCWAVSSTSALTDRFSIAMKQKIPVLSAVVTTSCATYEVGRDGCEGGFPGDAGCFFEQVGVPEDACFPYASFCGSAGTTCNTLQSPYTCCRNTLNKVSATGSRVQCQDFSSRVSSASNCQGSPGSLSGCLSGSSGNPKRYKAILGSTVSLADGTLAEIQNRMKLNIFSLGPIVASYFVNGSFILPTAFPQWGWKQTGGIYIDYNDESKESPYCQDPFVGQLFQWNQSQDPSHQQDVAVIQNQGIDFGNSVSEFRQNLNRYFNQKLGGHAVTVMGWGSGSSGPAIPGTMNYWIVRNSWSPSWNEQGYFKMAFQNPALDINIKTSMEIFWDKVTNTRMGGCTAFDALVPGNSSYRSSPPMKTGISHKDATVLYWVLGILAIGAIVGFFLWKHWTKARR